MKIFLFTLDFESCRVDQAAAQPKSLSVGLMEPRPPCLSLCRALRISSAGHLSCFVVSPRLMKVRQKQRVQPRSSY